MFRRRQSKGQSAPAVYGLILLAWALLPGCSTKLLTDPIVGPDYVVSNYFSKEQHLPPNLRRVAVLPVNYDPSDASAAAGRQSLERIFHSELNKAALFETVAVDPVLLEQWTGQSHWDDYDQIPANLLKTIADKTGAEAVLFSRLTHYKAYPPVLIGWRMKLVAPDADVLWAIEEVFDASQQAVSNSARRYERQHVRNNPALEDSRSILLSPARFGQYTLDAIFAALPKR